jgi:hypothetical protein
VIEVNGGGYPPPPVAGWQSGYPQAGAFAPANFVQQLPTVPAFPPAPPPLVARQANFPAGTAPREPAQVLKQMRFLGAAGLLASGTLLGLVGWTAPIVMMTGIVAALAFLAAPFMARASGRQLEAWTERGILGLAPRYGGRLSAIEVARELGVSLERAEKSLVRLSVTGFATHEIAEASGASVYTLHQASLPASERPRLGS